MVLLEVTLAEDHVKLGPRGSKILIGSYYIVSIKKADDGHSIIFLDLSDLDSFVEVHVEESYDRWSLLKLNP